MGRKLIIPKRPAATFLEDHRPIKRHKLEKRTLFDLLPMDVLNGVYDCII